MALPAPPRADEPVFFAAGNLRTVECGDGWVIFHRGSGRTHVLNDSAATILEMLGEAPRDAPRIAAELASHLGTDMEGLLVPVRDALADLAAVGLIDELQCGDGEAGAGELAPA